MANIVEGFGKTVSTFGWESIGSVLIIVLVFFGILLFVGTILFIMWYTSFNYSVFIYTPMGQRRKLSEEEKKRINAQIKAGDYSVLKQKKIVFDNVKRKKTRGKYVMHKGAPYFQTFIPLKRHEPIPMEYLYDTGIYFVKLSKDIFVPIHKPKTMVEVDENTTLSVTDFNKWRVWNNMMADRVNNKYQDIEAQKKIAFYFIAGIVAIVVVSGFVLWLIYSSVNKGFNAVDKLNTWADSVIGGGPK